MNQGSQGPSRVLDEFAKLMTDAAGVAQGARREMETAFRAQAERFLSQMDLVQREEFEVVKDMASKARLENDALRAELEDLKEAVKALSEKKVARKPAARKAKSTE